MIDVYWLDDINVGVSANTSSGRVTIHETKKKSSSIPLCNYFRTGCGCVVGYSQWNSYSTQRKSFPVPALTSEVKSLLVVRSQDKLQSPMGQLTTHKIMTGKNTGGRLPLLRWEAEEKWVGGRLFKGFYFGGGWGGKEFQDWKYIWLDIAGILCSELEQTQGFLSS